MKYKGQWASYENKMSKTTWHLPRKLLHLPSCCLIFKVPQIQILILLKAWPNFVFMYAQNKPANTN
jgi:hypothetical protein